MRRQSQFRPEGLNLKSKSRASVDFSGMGFGISTEEEGEGSMKKKRASKFENRGRIDDEVAADERREAKIFPGKKMTM